MVIFCIFVANIKCYLFLLINMEIIKTPLSGLLIIKPKVFFDERGSFLEIYQEKIYKANGIIEDFVQDNLSTSKKGVIRGLHFQKPPYAQAKLVRVIHGTALDIAVDLRKNSPTYGQHYYIILSATNHLQFFIPAGFAHGFAAIEDETVLSYKCSQFYNKESEGTIFYDDPTLNIHWQIENPIVSEKDKEGILFSEFVSPF